MSATRENLTAFVTGATGFVGSRLARHLVEAGWKVSVLLRPGSRLDQLAPIRQGIDSFTFDGDIQAFIAYLQNLRPDVVFHLATNFLPQHRSDDIPQLIQANVTFGTQLLEAMSQANVTRLVNAGTSWQHYRDSPFCPVNLYAATKQAFESILAYYCDARAFRAITLTIFDTYGPGDPRRKLVSLLAAAARQRKTLELSPGEQLLDMAFVDDVARAFIIAAHRTARIAPGAHESFALASGQRLSLRELVDLVREVMHIPIPVHFGGRPYREREVMSPWSNGNPLPGWHPQVTLAEGLAQTFRQDHP